MKIFKKRKGSVSIFVVVFAALLIMVIVLSFVRIMLQDQQQASETDLSHSALDSAQAGVEDAKRAIARYMEICNSGDSLKCAAVREKIQSKNCNESVMTLSDVAKIAQNNEIKVETNGGNKLDQAYTCVKVNLNTTDYLGKISTDQVIVVPLNSTGEFDTVELQWFSSENAKNGTSYEVNLLPPTGTDLPLLSQNSWGIVNSTNQIRNRPPMFRAQIVQFGSSGFSLSDFDNSTASNSNMNSIFLYPVGETNQQPNPASIASYNLKTFPARKDPNQGPQPVYCSGNLSSGGYACDAKLRIPDPIGGARLSQASNSSAALADGEVNDVANFGTNWQFVKPVGALGSVQLNNTVFFSSDNSALVDITQGSQYSGVRSKLSIAPAQNSQYRISLLAKFENGQSSDFVVRYSPDNGTQFVDCTNYDIREVNIEGWSRITCYLSTTPASSPSPYVYFVTGNSSTAKFFVDSMSISPESGTSTFLVLKAIYNNADYRITLSNSSITATNASGVVQNGVKFSAVQPEIDSTGRVSDLFRRIKTRIELADINFPYPVSAVDVNGSFCKDFSVTDNPADFNKISIGGNSYFVTNSGSGGNCIP